jgi:hypothetical protein
MTAVGAAADDDGHAPPLDERAPLDLPALAEIGEHGGQLVEPGVDRAPEPAPEARAELVIEFRDVQA